MDTRPGRSRDTGGVLGGRFAMEKNIWKYNDKPCIYAIVNKRNGHRYVGQTEHPNTRMATHFNLLNKGMHHNGYLQNAYVKYGVGSFDIELIEYIEHTGDLSVREAYWIDYYRAEYNDIGGWGSVLVNAYRIWRDEDVPILEFGASESDRPEWHRWVYGGGKNPLYRGNSGHK